MNYKAVLGIVGSAIVVGGIIYFATRYDFIKSSEDSECNENKNTDVVTYTSVTQDADQSNLNKTKIDAAETMIGRHEEAQNEIRKSVDNIFNGAGSEEAENEEAKKKMFEDLDDI